MQPPLRGNEAIMPPQHYTACCPRLPSGGKRRMPAPPGTAGGGWGGQKMMVWGRHHKACAAPLTSLVIVHWGFGADLHQHLDFFPNKDSRAGTFYFQLPNKVKFSYLGQGWRYCFGKVCVSAATSVLFPSKGKTLGRSIMNHLGFTTPMTQQKNKCVGVFASLIFTDEQKCSSSLWVFLVVPHAQQRLDCASFSPKHNEFPEPKQRQKSQCLQYSQPVSGV